MLPFDYFFFEPIPRAFFTAVRRFCRLACLRFAPGKIVCAISRIASIVELFFAWDSFTNVFSAMCLPSLSYMIVLRPCRAIGDQLSGPIGGPTDLMDRCSKGFPYFGQVFHDWLHRLGAAISEPWHDPFAT